jgi:hypothetical protein
MSALMSGNMASAYGISDQENAKLNVVNRVQTEHGIDSSVRSHGLCSLHAT